jgi:hypothetical protein
MGMSVRMAMAGFVAVADVLPVVGAATVMAMGTATVLAAVLATAMVMVVAAVVTVAAKLVAMVVVIMAAMVVWLHAPHITSVARMPAWAGVSRTDMDAAGRITKGCRRLPAVNFGYLTRRLQSEVA